MSNFINLREIIEQFHTDPATRNDPAHRVFIFKQGETDMGDKGKRDKGKKEQQKKAQLDPKEKRKQKKGKKEKKK